MPPMQQINEAPDLQFQINTVTDPYGRVATFHYLPTQVSGRWVVSEIDFPNGHKALYAYANGWLSTVTFDDGTQSSLTYGTDSTSQTSTVQFHDVAAEGTHRTKTVYLTNNMAHIYYSGAGDEPVANQEQVANQASLMVRMVANGAGEVTFLGLCGPYSGNVAPTAFNIYEGAGRLKQIQNHSAAPFFLDGWTIGDPTQGFNAVSGTLESTTAVIPNATTGEFPYLTDTAGHQFNYTYDANAYPTQKSSNDNTLIETWAYDPTFKQVTRYQDRNLNVTLNTYDARGNLLSREVGIKNVGGVDTHQPEYGKYQWTYFPTGNANQYLMSAAIDANGNETDFVYDNNHKLLQVIEPPDAPGGARATTTIAYDVSSRIQTITDPVSRQVQFAYDQRDRNVTITYGDTSTEKFYYGAQGTGNENLLVKSKDRNGVTNQLQYDAAGRLATTTIAYSIVDANNNETLITDPSVQVTSAYSYLPGTELIITNTLRGEATNYAYDYRQRMLTKTVQPRVGTTLTTSRSFQNNLLFSQTDPYGRAEYFAYRSSDGELIRQIQGTVPSFTLANFAAVTNQARAAGSNAQYLITDFTLDSNGQRTATLDGNNIQETESFDSRGQTTQVVDAAGTVIAGTTRYFYDSNGNMTAVEYPRYFDPNDPQTGKCQSTKTYTARNLLASMTEAPGTPAAATTSFTHNLDRTEATRLDPRNNTWETLWSTCCAGRKSGDLDPQAAGTNIVYDDAGNVTFIQILQGTTIFNQSTATYDARRRRLFRTDWLIDPPAVDPNNPPIAGQNGVPAANGLTTQWVYDENLADNVGLSAPAGQNIAGIGNVSIAPLLGELSADGITFGAGSDGFAALEISPDGELAVSILDGVGRTVGTGIIQPPTGNNPNQPITWSVRLDDTVVNVNGFGNVLETASIDALDNTSRDRTDGAGRVIQSLDAANNVTTNTFDANSNRLSSSDPNSVGYTAVYDARNRESSRTDTANATVQTQYDANSNVVKTIDAKTNAATATFDARDRMVTATDRINGVASWTLDANSNMLAITDSESRTTAFTYDSRNLKLSETYADNNPPGVVDVRSFTYDGARRPATIVLQTGDYITLVFDSGNRLNQRQYRASGIPPSDPPSDADSFTFDGSGHLLTATSGRYSNTLTFTYDQAGRLSTEALTIGGPTYAIARSHDAAGRVTGVTYPDGSVVANTFTSRSQLQQVNYMSTLVASFTYDGAGRRSTRTLGDTPGTQTTYAYSTGDDTLASISTPNLPGYSYSYDANKNKTGETITGVLQPYGFSTGAAGYDNANRLVAWDRTDGNKNQSWTLTGTGDWSQFVDTGTTQTRTHNNVHEATAINSTGISYDSKGNLASNGVTGWSYTWDFDNQLQQATHGGATVALQYDALGRRVSKSSGGATTVYVSSNAEANALAAEVAEYALGGAPAAAQRTYVLGEAADDTLLMSSAGARYFYQANALGSVAAVTDSSGALLECYAYTAYGAPLILAPDGVTQRSSSSVGNSLSYTGRRFDIETGLFYYRARHYDPLLGRFLSRDPMTLGPTIGETRLGTEPLEWANLYEYAASAATLMTDPSGLVDRPPIKLPPKKKRPKKCSIYLCCGQLDPTVNPKTKKPDFACQFGAPANIGLVPCHCFLITDGPGRYDYQNFHGHFVPDASCGRTGRRLVCGPFPKLTGGKGTHIPGTVNCVALKTTKTCDSIRECLKSAKPFCNRGFGYTRGGKNRPLCYGECGWPNSNTVAYSVGSWCSGTPSPATPPVAGTGCDPAAGGIGAPGYTTIYPIPPFPFIPYPRLW